MLDLNSLGKSRHPSPVHASPLIMLGCVVQITDTGAQMLLDSLAMDRSMMLLDLSSNQLTTRR